MPPPWFFCNLRLPISRLSTELFSKRPIHSIRFLRMFTVNHGFGTSAAKGTHAGLLQIINHCAARKSFSSIRPVLRDHCVKLLDQCGVSSKTFSTSTLGRTKNIVSSNKMPPPKIDLGKRQKKGGKRKMTTRERNVTALFYLLSAAVGTVGASYAAVPLYRAYCQSSGYGGTVKEGHDTEKVETMVKAEDRLLTIKFNADTASSMRWNFRPQQPVVHVYPGETALAFYTARNPTEKPIDGISTYNVVPFEAAPYFNKIQCFCFEEQRLNPNEEVDMPVFFYIDPDYVDDPFLENCHEITLSYTFFESKPGLKLPTYMSSARS